MKRLRSMRPTPSMAVALLALVVALGGTATAASVLITSSKQIKAGSISASDLSRSAQKSLKGKAGLPVPRAPRAPQEPPAQPALPAPAVRPAPEARRMPTAPTRTPQSTSPPAFRTC